LKAIFSHLGDEDGSIACIPFVNCILENAEQSYQILRLYNMKYKAVGVKDPTKENHIIVEIDVLYFYTKKVEYLKF